MDGRERPCPLRAAGGPYPARRHVRQQNWMKSLRSQSRLDFTISQKVSSAGVPGERRETGQSWVPVHPTVPPLMGVGDVQGARVATGAALAAIPVTWGAQGGTDGIWSSGAPAECGGGRVQENIWAASEVSVLTCTSVQAALLRENLGGSLGEAGTGLEGAGTGEPCRPALPLAFEDVLPFLRPAWDHLTVLGGIPNNLSV